MDGRTDRWMDGRMDGRMDGQTDRQNLSLCYRILSPVEAAAQKGEKPMLLRFFSVTKAAFLVSTIFEKN